MTTDTLTLPPVQTDEFAWYGPDMVKRQKEWFTMLSDNEIMELEAAAAIWNAKNRNIATITMEDFPLPTLGPKLLKIREELIHGRGFALLRGLPCNKYTEQ